MLVSISTREEDASKEWRLCWRGVFIREHMKQHSLLPAGVGDNLRNRKIQEHRSNIGQLQTHSLVAPCVCPWPRSCPLWPVYFCAFSFGHVLARVCVFAPGHAHSLFKFLRTHFKDVFIACATVVFFTASFPLQPVREAEAFSILSGCAWGALGVRTVQAYAGRYALLSI